MGWFTSSPSKPENASYEAMPDISCPRCGHEYVEVIPPTSGYCLYRACCSRCGFGKSSGSSEKELLRELHGRYYQNKNDREDSQLLSKQLMELLKNIKA
jgi:hypothetical protein